MKKYIAFMLAGTLLAQNTWAIDKGDMKLAGALYGKFDNSAGRLKKDAAHVGSAVLFGGVMGGLVGANIVRANVDGWKDQINSRSENLQENYALAQTYEKILKDMIPGSEGAQKVSETLKTLKTNIQSGEEAVASFQKALKEIRWPKKIVTVSLKGAALLGLSAVVTRSFSDPTSSSAFMAGAGAALVAAAGWQIIRRQFSPAGLMIAMVGGMLASSIAAESYKR